MQANWTVEEDCTELRQRIQELEKDIEGYKEELKLLDFWESLIQQGVDTKDLIRSYAKLEAAFTLFKEKSASKIEKLNQDLARKTKQFNEVAAQLKKS